MMWKSGTNYMARTNICVGYGQNKSISLQEVIDMSQHKAENLGWGYGVGHIKKMWQTDLDNRPFFWKASGKTRKKEMQRRTRKPDHLLLVRQRWLARITKEILARKESNLWRSEDADMSSKIEKIYYFRRSSFSILHHGPWIYREYPYMYTWSFEYMYNTVYIIHTHIYTNHMTYHIFCMFVGSRWLKNRLSLYNTEKVAPGTS